MLGPCNVLAGSVDTYHADRRRFSARLAAEPFFLLRHMPFLSAAVFGKVGTRLKLAIRDPQLGTKLWPGWLLPERRVLCNPAAPLQLLRQLPRSTRTSLSVETENDGKNNFKIGSQSDPENYLADNRWGQLLHVPRGDDRERDLAIARVEKWIASHQDMGDAAWECYSACERVANSLVFFAGIACDSAPCPISDAYAGYLRRSMEWIYGHIEYYGAGRTNNHILNNGRALAMGGAVLGDRTVVSAGMKILKEFLPRIVTGGGYLRERSSHYQLIVLNWVTDAWWFLRSSDRPDAQDVAFLEDYVHKMSLAAASLLNQQGQLCALIGDVSPDWTPRQTLARLSTLYPDIWPPTRQSLPPCEARDGWFRLATADAIVLGNFVEGDFPLSYPTHGHNDLTGFVWAKGGETILTDPGRFRYTSDPLSLQQKSAAGHSVPMVNGFAPFCETLLPNAQWWPRPYACATADITIGPKGITLSHDGFSRATPVKRHTRKISLDADCLQVVDIFDGDGDVRITLCWHFGGEYSAFDKDELVVKSRTSEVKLELLHPESRKPIPLDLCATTALQESLCYGESTPTLGLRLELAATLPTQVMTRFSVLRCVA